MILHGFHRLRCFLLLPLAMLVMLSACIKSPSEPAVQEPSSITLSSSRIVLTSISQRVLLTATVLDQDSRVISDATIFFRSGNVKIATVSDNGLVTAVSMGTTQINVSSGYATASATVTVMQEAGRIEITPSSATLESVGETVQLKAEVYDTGSTIIPGAVVVWSSSHPTVATVDANGIVTAVSSGTTQITATSGGESTYRPVYVVLPQPAARIELNISQATLTSIGQSLKLDALVYDIDGMAIPDAPVSWTSSHPAVATVDSTGLVSAVSNGTTLITATSGGVSTFATIHVVIEGTVAPPEPSIDRDVFFAFYHATGGPNWTNNTNWLSEAPLDEWYGVATDSDGRVRTLSLGDNNLIGSLPPALGQLVNLEILDLNTNQLAGIIPADLGDLVNLTWLQLRDNQLIGRIPAELGQLSNLTGMFFGSNRLMGSIPSELGQLIDLEQLELDRNQLSGGIPAELGQLSNLVRLDLGNNHLAGGIPSELGKLTSLAQLDLSLNEITGSIPAELGQLTNLRGLRLGTNQLAGGIPVDLGQLTMLDTIDFGSNQLTGPVPSELGGLTRLRSLDLQNNMDLSGPLPAELVSVPLETLKLNGTQLCAPLEATFQAWLAGINDKTVENCTPVPEPEPEPEPEPDPEPVVDRIEIVPPSATLTSVGAKMQLAATVYDTNNDVIAGASVTWESGDTNVATVDTDGLVTAVARGRATITATSDTVSASASISVDLPAERIDIDPDSVTLTSVGATEQLAATVYDANAEEIIGAPVAWSSGDPSVATVNANGLVTAVADGSTTITARSDTASASIQVTVMTENPDRDVLVELYNATDGPNWTTDTNWLSEMPLEEWHGVSTNANGRVTGLSLRSNNLVGSLPSSLGELSNLTNLDIHSNSLTGSIPTSLGNLTNLTNLDFYSNSLTGSIPTSLGNLTNLTKLSLRNNDLINPIPSSLGSLSNLTDLSLDGNDLSGEIPSTLGNLKELQNLYLSNNGLTGPIPLSLGKLSKLEWFSLASNALTGSIPPSLGNLSELKHLTLDHNEMSGVIPTTMGNLSNLWYLSLQDMKLSGPIPPSLGDLSNLTILSVARNNLTGTIPSSLGNLSNLRVLSLFDNRLSDPIPSSLGDLAELENFYLHSNALTGSIPPSLGKLVKVKDFRLDSNELIGSIPPTLGNLAEVTQLLLRENNLTGSIPSSLGNLSKLKNLGLAGGNEFMGCIPSSLHDVQSNDLVLLELDDCEE